LIYPDAATGKPSSIDLESLRSIDSGLIEADLRKSLPRFDAPALQTALTIPKMKRR